MGNYISCATSRVPSSTVRVMHADGRLEEFQRPIKAAELMLENSQQFVCHSNALEIGRRVIPLSADEELEMGSFYLLLPMHKLHSVLSESDMWFLSMQANSAVKRTSKGTTKILPMLGDVRSIPSKSVDNICAEIKEAMRAEEAVIGAMTLGDIQEQAVGLATQRMRRCSSWKPKLETITEARMLKRSADYVCDDIGDSKDAFREP